MSEQTKAIHSKIKLGREIQRLHPEVAVDFLSGKTYDQIIVEHDLTSKYGSNNLNYLRGGLHYALYGVNSVSGNSYEGLVDPQLLLKRHSRHLTAQGMHMRSFVTEEMCRDNGQKSGSTAYTKKTGIFALTPKEQYQNSSDGGKKSSELGLGIHSDSVRNDSKRKKKASENSLESRGLVAWTPGEEGLLFLLGYSELSHEEITSYLNQAWHPNNSPRNLGSIRCRLYGVRKKGSLKDII